MKSVTLQDLYRKLEVIFYSNPQSCKYYKHMNIVTYRDIKEGNCWAVWTESVPFPGHRLDGGFGCAETSAFDISVSGIVRKIIDQELEHWPEPCGIKHTHVKVSRSSPIDAPGV